MGLCREKLNFRAGCIYDELIGHRPAGQRMAHKRLKAPSVPSTTVRRASAVHKQTRNLIHRPTQRSIHRPTLPRSIRDSYSCVVPSRLLYIGYMNRPTHVAPARCSSVELKCAVKLRNRITAKSRPVINQPAILASFIIKAPLLTPEFSVHSFLMAAVPSQ